ncbi:tetratricopeptide repeat protein [Solitalea canadensis]|uniref:Uncharacterized protein n=1 Tax=Solitalea canadensis (strain ATCC 29591 / DSM 3403 / JCM 21819 / LMG 8368 / NBRC 15130 / NCIMB 12057 / USAM 9D) TaxID=929556 RepID=H8KN96_SOLCM|nr:hypothetical protein [Solitalea canadensis]AFD09429.1 hypothetical protein Solca_4439 [Solitalea canadensis DSM 3403]
MTLVVLRTLTPENNGVYLPECINALNLEIECENAIQKADDEANINMAIVNEMLGDHYFDRNDFEKSLVYYKEALDLFGSSINPSLFLNIGKCYYSIGIINKAEDYLFLAFNMSGGCIIKGNEQYFSFLMSKTQIA